MCEYVFDLKVNTNLHNARFRVHCYTSITNMAIESHDQNREKLCLICFAKKSRSAKIVFVKIVSGGKLEKLINSHFEYSANDKRYPNAICQGCRKKLYTAKDNSAIKCPDLKLFDKNPARSSARSATSSKHHRCGCKLCDLIRTPLIQPVGNGKYVVQRRVSRKPYQSEFI